MKRASIQVRRQNRYLPFLQIGEHSAENDYERVRLLTRGATGTPDPELAAEIVASTNELWHDLLLEDLEAALLSEKVGLANR